MSRIKLGHPYTSMTFVGIWVPQRVDRQENKLDVRITSPTGSYQESWNLKHTEVGLQNGTYSEHPELQKDSGTLIVCPTQLLHSRAQPPQFSGPYAMGHDICTVMGLEGLEDHEKWSSEQLAAWAKCGADRYYDLEPGQSFLFRTGFKQAIQPGWGCLLWDRSGMGGSKLIHRFAGVIDEDYRGEWFVRLVNFSQETHRIEDGARIVQGIYQQRVHAMCPAIQSLDDTQRGRGGFGSTGD